MYECALETYCNKKHNTQPAPMHNMNVWCIHASCISFFCSAKFEKYVCTPIRMFWGFFYIFLHFSISLVLNLFLKHLETFS